MKLTTRLGLGAVALAFLVANMISEKAAARPNYLKAFAAKYKNLADQVKAKKCGTCHYGKSKKNRNDYGVALSKATGKKAKGDKVTAALTKTESVKKGDTGKTFGELIKAGKLPGTAPK